MKDSHYNKEINIKLFKQNCISNEELTNTAELQKLFNNLVKTFGWEKIVSECYDYLKCSINSRIESFNFATWLFIYDFGKCSVKNPYPFLALLYNKMELDTSVVDDLDTRFDTPYDRFLDIYIDVLISSKIIDISESDYIVPEKDDRLLAELKKI